MLEVIISAVMSFVGTNIDDLFVDTIFFAGVEEGKAQVRRIVIGKYLGIGALVLVSLLGAFGLQLLPGKYIGFLGLVPMGLGIKAGVEYFKERSDTDKVECLQKCKSLLWSVALVTIANGADNIGVYVPLFAGYGFWQLGVLVCVFAVMIAVWCLIAKRLADFPLLRRVLIKYKGVIVPVVFVALGVYIMMENFWL